LQNSILINEIENLPSDFWDFKKHDTRDNSHGIHFYPATMIYPISKSIINIFIKYEKVTAFLDPFMGSGTTLVEAKICGIPKVYGIDLNPLAEILSEVKTTNLTDKQLNEIESFINIISAAFATKKDTIIAFDKYIRNELGLDITNKKGWGDNAQQYINEFCNMHKINSATIKKFTNMGYWFVPKAILSLQIIKQELDKIINKNIKKFLLVALSETVRLVSNTRNSEFKLFRKPPEQVTTFNPDVEYEFIRILKHNIGKIKRFNELSAKSETMIHLCLDDTRILNSVPDNSIDLVVTSPPYGDSKTTVAYGQYSRLALHWLDLDNITENQILQLDNNMLGGHSYLNKEQWALTGSRTLQETLGKIAEKDSFRADDVFSFYLDLDKCLQAIAKKTKTGGYHFWVVGNRTVKLETLRTDKIVIELAQKHGLEFVYNFGRNVSNKTMPKRNSPTNESGKTVETMTKEHIVVLRKI
jgi:16S rRNA G966 N2-methylase RsmD